MSNNVNYVARRSVPCYFCSEFIEERYLPEHVKHCGAVLEECPNKCGAYIPRDNLKSHKAQCGIRKSKRFGKSEETQTSTSSDELVWKERVMSILNLLRNAIDDNKKEQKEFEDKFEKNLETLRSKESEFEALRISSLETNNGIRLSNDDVDYRLSRLEQSFNNIEEQISLNFKQISDQLETVQIKLNDEEFKGRTKTKELNDELEGFRTFLNNENVMISAIWHEQLKQIHDLKLELEMRCRESKKLVKTQGIISEKIDILVTEIRKHSDAITNQVTQTKALKFKLKENINYLEDMIKDIATSRNSSGNINCPCLTEEHYQSIPTNGRLLWRIDRYKEKMTDAKDNDSVLCSPIFYNKEYGYTLRVELFLNGKGQWKDRHIIGSLKVLEGKWDPLLDWPCILQANVVLRDQENPANNVKKLLKVKRQDAVDDPSKMNKESGVYMFIPHTKLTRHDGLTKNNIMFLDIQVKDFKIGGSMASLL